MIKRLLLERLSLLAICRVMDISLGRLATAQTFRKPLLPALKPEGYMQYVAQLEKFASAISKRGFYT